MADAMKKLMSKRKLAKCSITRALTFSQDPPEDYTSSDVESRLARLEAVWEEFSEYSREMYDFEGDEKFVDPETEFLEYEEKYLTAQGILKALLQSMVAPDSHIEAESKSDIFTKLAGQQATLLEKLEITPTAKSGNTKLPKIIIDPFSGSYKEWPSFKDIFTSAVDSRKDLTAVQKFYYLKSLLKNDAANLIRHLQICDSSYETAWGRLKERYDRPRYIVNSYIETFMTLPSLKEENVDNLRKVSDVSNEVIRGLDAIDESERDPWLIFILVSKLDMESRRRWAEKSRDDTKPTISTFLIFLDQRCEELDLSVKPVNKAIGFRSKPSSTLLTTNENECADCGSIEHRINKCPHFLSLNVEQRRSFIREKSLCFNCLRPGHVGNKCRSDYRCRECKRSHHTLVHNGPTANVSTLDSENIAAETQGHHVSLNTVISPLKNESLSVSYLTHILPTALVDVRCQDGSFTTCRVLLDTASELSYATEGCIKRLGLSRSSSRIALSGISSIKAETTRGHSFIHIRSKVSSHCLDACVHILGRITSSLPRSSITSYDHERLCNVSLADPSFFNSSPIDILLGADCVWNVLTMNKLYDDKGNTLAVSSVFGWVVTSVSTDKQQNTTSSLVSLIDVENSLRAFWEIEECATMTTQDEESVVVEQHFLETHSRHTDGKYIVELPFKDPDVKFGNTYHGALSRFKANEYRLSKNNDLRLKYIQFMRDYHSLGHMKQIPSDKIDIQDGRLYYLPHHPVVGAKLRVVFDGSFRDCNGTSLNDQLYIGPAIQRNLFAVCLRFRLYRFVFSADIIKMFRQIWVAQNHRDFQRILWREDPSEPLQHYQLCTVTYGTSSAPFISVRVLQQLANDYKESHPTASSILLEDFYVDDVLTGAATEQELLHNRNELMDLLSLAGLELSKWVSNCEALRKRPCEDSHDFLKSDGLSTVKVLGIHWNSVNDNLEYKVNLCESKEATKRTILSDVAKVFDPLGLVSPVIIKFKIMFQDLWLLDVTWDDPLPQHLSDMWTKYRKDLYNLENLKLPRLIPDVGNGIELIGFSDASIKAYAAVVYCRTKDNCGNIHISLIASKTRVAPLKQISLPRLELCGALLLTRLMESIISSLPKYHVELRAWCDSTVVLSWLSMQPSKLKTFVANRTSEILDTLPRSVWGHVNTKANPADCASRGIMAEQLINYELWWKGPDFLRQSQTRTCTSQPCLDSSEVKAEMKTQTINLVTKLDDTENPLECLVERVSSWWKLIRVVAYVKRFIKFFVAKTKITSAHLTFDEIAEAKITCLILAQSCYANERELLQKDLEVDKRSKIVKLSPFLDNMGLIRVGGRIQNSELDADCQHPIILPKEHRVTQMILEHEHTQNFHPGVSALFVIIRQKYWVFGARNLIRKLTHQCIKCFRYSKHLSQQRMAELPKVRVTQSFPFQNTGCDYAGPLTLKICKGRNPKYTKGYICLFVCMVTSAIHLELSTDLSSECFLAALRRFMSRRGKCSTIYSDNGKNFVGANRKLNEMYQHLQQDTHNEIVSTYLAKEGVKWTFIPPYSPHWGGMWESGVRSVKLHLRRVIGDSILTHEQMHTLLTQVEAVVNSRPLGYAPDIDMKYLSPSHFLLGRPTTMVPETDLTNIPTNRLDYWQNVQCMYQGFWKRWSQEYLTSLQQRPKWCKIQPNLAVDELVIVKEDKIPPSMWIIGRIIETFPGKDGLTRAVKLHTAQGTMTRPIVKLVKLPLC